jgi:hypothetical protein
MLTALDLFSGIGGFARALKGIATTKRYCDVDPVARACLSRNMEAGLIDRAPIEEDILTLKGSNDIDMVVGGVPCLGFSPLGLQHGFDHIQTKLFFELMRVVDECRPSLVFLENVPNIVCHGMHTVVEELHKQRGYDLLWIVLPAYAAGAIHSRLRWFCLARLPGATHVWKDLSFVRHEFTSNEPPRMIRKGDPLWDQRGKRCTLLGNSIVPCAARMAFFMLASGFRQGNITAPTLTMGEPCEGLRTTLDESKPGFIFPRWGGVDRHSVFSIPVMHFKRPITKFRLLQKQPLQYPLTERVTSPVIYGKQFGLWSTPRAGCVGSSRILTERSCRDLPTQVKFEVGTPEHLRDGQLNPDWVEVVLMGYPRGYSRYK